MADVTGPISSLPGSRHKVPQGQMCDEHPERLAIARIQGETDSFGSEMLDMCQQCLEEYQAFLKSPEALEAKKGNCEWCKSEATDLRDHRDYEEGSCGRIYRVCGECIRKENERLEIEISEYYDEYD